MLYSCIAHADIKFIVHRHLNYLDRKQAQLENDLEFLKRSDEIWIYFYQWTNLKAKEIWHLIFYR